MAHLASRISTCLWFDSEAEDAAKFYTSIFKNSSIGQIVRYSKEGFEYHGKPESSVMTVSFVIDGLEFLGLNGGPLFKFNESISFIINCDTQDEIDYYWEHLTQGGEEVQCGWLKDKFGVSWQVNPTILNKMMTDPDAQKAHRATEAMFQMKKFNIKKLEEAFNGQ